MNVDFADELVESPIGVALLAELEAMQRPDVLPREILLKAPDAQAVDHATEKAAQPLNTSQFVDIDWRAASQDYDGCYLSWAGFLTTEGYVCDLGDGRITSLHGFGSERTLWPADVFGEATPLKAPGGLTGSSSGDYGTDVTIDHQRAAQNLINLEVTLGRREPPSRADQDGATTRAAILKYTSIHCKGGIS